MKSFAIIPAAGRSQRMGQPKLLLPWRGTTVIEHVVGVWRSSRVDHVVVIIHPSDVRLAELAHGAGAHLLQPDPPPPEMKISVREGLAFVERRFHPSATDAWLMAPADMPGIDAAMIDALLEAYQASLDRGIEPRIWVPQVGGRRGHPVLFPWRLATEVERLGPDEGLDALVARSEVRAIDFPERERLADFDTPEDYERLSKRPLE
jgi:molybdenum cofactor cytidylyltransferase